MKRVLVSAYACEPDKGSEPEVGLQAVLAAASEYEVWVLTRSNNLRALRSHLESHPFGGRVHLEGLDLGGFDLALKKRLGAVGLYRYYARWQRAAGRHAKKLHAEHRFDLVHHATFATYWQPTVGSALDIPFVWGPIGGGAVTPWRLLLELGWRGVLRDAVRLVAQRTAERLPSVRSTMAAATVALVQNPETACRVVGPKRTIVAPNGVAASVQEVFGGKRTAEIVMVGRQIPYKAGVLGVRTLAALRNRDATLVCIGSGPERSRMERTARRLGVADRVVFPGRMPRSEVIARMSRAAALLHPALHDDSPLTVCEALAVGTPVVALDIGGPPVLVARWPDVPSVIVSPSGRRETVARLAAAVDECLERVAPIPAVPIPPVPTFGESVLEAYRIALAAG